MRTWIGNPERLYDQQSFGILHSIIHIGSISKATVTKLARLCPTCLSRRIVHIVLAGIMLGMPVFMSAGELAPNDQEISAISKKYGQAAANRIQKWREILLSDIRADESRKLELVNRFFNTLPFVSDLEHWGKMDYWATPLEFLETNGGDCEDFAIAKYLTLREIGVPADRLRITYVKALTLNQAHMVLTYYPTPDAEPLVLDNLQSDIMPASQRQDLIPVYSFNGDNLWLAKELTGRSQLVGESERIGLWRDLLKRLIREQETRH